MPGYSYNLYSYDHFIDCFDGRAVQLVKQGGTGVNEGVPWSQTEFSFSRPCGLEGIRCDNADNQPRLCGDFRFEGPLKPLFSAI